MMTYLSEAKTIWLLNDIKLSVKAAAVDCMDGELEIIDYIYELPRGLTSEELEEAHVDLARALDEATWIF
jgi:hypothetical protein